MSQTQDSKPLVIKVFLLILLSCILSIAYNKQASASTTTIDASHEGLSPNNASNNYQLQRILDKHMKTVDCKINPNAVRTKKISFL
ncbi:hypothetical protein [Lactiplantibacillus plantarum]|uniref:hypothetical protein n=1 Tax=Lactiplantibacillus plantarum TaxID=1590 RepID=UPI00218223A2|nr:hypothetical protein [Lactiplantibacillus plantarum]